MSRKFIVGLLLATGATFPLRESPAGWLDFSVPKRSAKAVRRGEATDAGVSPSAPQGDDKPVAAATVRASGRGLERVCDCCEGCYPGGFNCGDNDHYLECTRFHRQKCGETWYPRVAPYCRPSWGWTQPCWRRAVDNYNCPRPVALPAMSPQSTPRSPESPRTAPPATVLPPESPSEPPPPPADADSVQQTARIELMNGSTATPQIERPKRTGLAEPIPARKSRWSFTSSGD
jgi:hypothetical protein